MQLASLPPIRILPGPIGRTEAPFAQGEPEGGGRFALRRGASSGPAKTEKSGRRRGREGSTEPAEGDGSGGCNGGEWRGGGRKFNGRSANAENV